MMMNLAKSLRLRRFRWLPVTVIAFTLLVLGGIVAFSSARLRATLREQISGRDAQFIYALTRRHTTDADLFTLTDDPADQFATILHTSQLPELAGLLATRLFSQSGELIVAFPEDVLDSALTATEIEKLTSPAPLSRLVEDARLSDYFMTAEPDLQPTGPILEITIPLQSAGNDQSEGFAQFILDGKSLATEFARLDQHLGRQALLLFLLGGGILTAALAFAFRNLERAHSLLSRRTESLIQANRELSMLAKTSALGSITAHLIHGLKNPLFGIQNYMSARDRDEPSDLDWNLVVSSTQKMQSMVNNVVRVLREEQRGDRYEMSLVDLKETIVAKLAPAGQAAGVELSCQLSGDTVLTNHQANLLLLILENLLQNGIEATPRGGHVQLDVGVQGPLLTFEVADQGPGLPPHVRETLFKPCHSSKQGGNGIGLAISKQLANHLGAELELKSTSPQGSVFALSLRQTLPAPASALLVP